MSDERRKYVRVSADCMISFRILSDTEDEHKSSRDRFDPISSIELSDITSKVHAEGDQRDEMILELLLWIDWKVNYMIKTLLKGKEAVIFPFEADMVDLSAAGMLFSTFEQVPLHATLEFRFFLPVLPFNEMILRGIVNRSRQKTVKMDSVARFEIGVEFQSMKESEQEFIFRYVLKRERQILQAQREEEAESSALRSGTALP